MTHLTLRFLGAPAIERDGAAVAMDTRKATALLAYLAVTGRAHGRETLAALLWPEYDDEHARAALRRTLSTLRTALDAPHLVVDRDTVSLVPGAGLWVDVTEFRARLAACQTHGHSPAEVCPACLPLLADAAALYRGDFLTGFTLRDSAEFDDWQFAQAEALRGELAGALERLAAGQSAAGDFAAALASARRWLALDPLREEAHRQVMRLYAWADQRNAALRQYRECVRILQGELGVAPLAETVELYEAIKGNRLPAPATSARSGFREPEAARLTPAVAAPAVSQPAWGPAGKLPLVGRAAELSALTRAYERHAASGYFAAIEGEAGVGKTRLAEELLAHVRGRGATAITVRCYEGEAGVAYGPIVEGLRAALAQAACDGRLDALPAHWLAEAGRLLPELSALRPGLPPPPPLDAPGGQSHFFEGLRQTFGAMCAGPVPNVLCFDDVHWADAASLDLLAYLARRLRGQPLFILATWRSDAGPALSRLRGLAAETQRAGNGATLTLHRLALADVLELARTLAAAGAGLPEGSAGRLHHETEGLPLFLAAYLEALAQEDVAGEGGAWAVPRGVTDLLAARLTAVGDAARQALQAAAVIGRSFDLDALQAVSGRSDEEIVSALEVLAGRGIVRELAGEGGAIPRYDFTHERLRSLVYDDTSLARRRLLHGRAARALAERTRGRREMAAQAAPIGRHYGLAGQEAEAATWLAAAGDHARGLYANAEALAHYQAALALGHPDPRRLHEAAGDMHTLLGAYAAALTSYELAAALCDPVDPALAEIEHKLGNVHARLGAWLAAEAHFAAALDVAGGAVGREELSALRQQDTPPQDVLLSHAERVNGSRLAAANDPLSISAQAGRILADWSLAAHAQGQTERASALAGEALAAAEAADDRPGLAQAHNILGILARSRGDSAGAVGHLARGLAVAEQLPDPTGRIALRNNLALARADGGDLAGATALAEEALALCVEMGDRHREAALHNNLADLLHAAGREAEAMAQLKQAVVIFAEIGVQAGDAGPEIWKLTEW